MKWTKHHPRMWMAAAGYFLLAGILALIPDTAMQTMVAEDRLTSVTELMEGQTLVCLCVIPAAMQFFLNRMTRMRFLSFMPLLLGAAALFLAEGFWITGDWERLASAFFLGLFFIPSVCMSLEILLEKLVELCFRKIRNT